MYKNLIQSYVQNLKKEDIIKYINQNNYCVSDKEIDVIYFYIKNYWEDIYKGDEGVLEKLKSDVSENTYLEIMKLYDKAKKFI